MRVRVEMIIEVDLTEWNEEYCCNLSPRAMRPEVKDYVKNAVTESYAHREGIITVVS